MTTRAAPRPVAHRAPRPGHLRWPGTPGRCRSRSGPSGVRDSASSARRGAREAVQAPDLRARSARPGGRRSRGATPATRPAEAAWLSRSVQVCQLSTGARLSRMPGTPVLGQPAPRAREAAPVGRRDHQQAARGEPLAQRGQAGARVLQVLQHVGQRDQVERALRAARTRCPPRRVSRSEAPMSREAAARVLHRLGREVDADAREPALGEPLQQEAGAAAHVQHAARSGGAYRSMVSRISDMRLWRCQLRLSTATRRGARRS